MKELRIQLGISQQQLADRLKVPRSAIAMAENGKRPYPEDYAIKIMELQEAKDAVLERKFENDLSNVYIRETKKALNELIVRNNFLLATAYYQLKNVKFRLEKAIAYSKIPPEPQKSAIGSENSLPDLSEMRIAVATRKAQQVEGREKMKMVLLEQKIKVLEFENKGAERWVLENGG